MFIGMVFLKKGSVTLRGYSSKSNAEMGVLFIDGIIFEFPSRWVANPLGTKVSNLTPCGSPNELSYPSFEIVTCIEGYPLSMFDG